MKVISLQHATGEAKYIRNEYPDVFSACFMENSDPVEIARFDTEEEARTELKKCKSTARVMETCTGKGRRVPERIRLQHGRSGNHT